LEEKIPSTTTKVEVVQDIRCYYI